jgi:hypothetical protein
MPLFDDYDGKDNRKCLSVQSSIQTLYVVNNFLPLSKEFNLPLSIFLIFSANFYHLLKLNMPATLRPIHY